jgi:hypothetical protein
MPLLTGTTSGRLTCLGAALQLPFVLLLGARAYLWFPEDASTQSLGLAFMHLAAVLSLLGCWFYYGVVMRAEKSKFLYVLITLIAIAPLFVSVGTIRNG